MDPFVQNLLKRIEALETGIVPTKQLPVKQLREKILFDEPVDPVQLLLPKSVVGENIADENVEKTHLSPALKSELGI